MININFWNIFLTFFISIKLSSINKTSSLKESSTKVDLILFDFSSQFIFEI